MRDETGVSLQFAHEDEEQCERCLTPSSFDSGRDLEGFERLQVDTITA